MELAVKALRLLAGILLAGGALIWLLLGGHRGWTKTSVPRKVVDEVTGIEGVTYERHFVPGVDFLGAVLLGSGVLAGVSFLFRKPTTYDSSQEN